MSLAVVAATAFSVVVAVAFALVIAVSPAFTAAALSFGAAASSAAVASFLGQVFSVQAIADIFGKPKATMHYMLTN